MAPWWWLRPEEGVVQSNLVKLILKVGLKGTIVAFFFRFIFSGCPPNMILEGDFAGYCCISLSLVLILTNAALNHPNQWLVSLLAGHRRRSLVRHHEPSYIHHDMIPHVPLKSFQ
jgi:hypothetical protein